MSNIPGWTLKDRIGIRSGESLFKYATCGVELVVARNLVYFEIENGHRIRQGTFYIYKTLV